MKKLSLIFVLFLTACASTGKGIDTSSNCKYSVNGLECKREQVWQMMDASGNAFEKQHTSYWFESHSDCEKFRKDPDNYDLLRMESNNPVVWCGTEGKGDSSADVSNYYIYSDDSKTEDFYYVIPAGLIVKISEANKYQPYGKEEVFTALFTSKTALKRFQRTPHDKLFTVYGYSINYAKRMKVKRMY